MKLKLAEHNCRLAEYHNDEEEETTGEEEETNDVNPTFEEELRKLVTITIGGVMIAFKMGILSFFVGDAMAFVFLGYCTGLPMRK